MKKICLISPKFLDYVGGMETHAYEFANWVDRDPDLELVSIITKKEVSDGILVQRSKSNYLDKYVKRVLTANFDKDLDCILSNSPEETDVYFFNSPNWIPIVEGLKKLRGNAKIIVRSGGTDLVAGWIGNENDVSQNIITNRKIVSNIINSYVDLLIVNSEFSRKRCAKIGIDESKMLVVLGGVDCSLFNPVFKLNNSEKIKILHVSRFVTCKGVENTLKVFKLALDKLDFDLIIIPHSFAVVGKN